MTEESQISGAQADAPKPQFALQRIYVKDLSFESPMSITQRPQSKPSVTQDLHTRISKIAESHYEVVLNLTVTVKQDDTVAFLAEVHQAGLFQVSGLEEAQLQQMLSSACPSILFPYAREAIDSMAIRGGFPPLMLPPINFDAIYLKVLSEAQNRAKTAGDASDVH